MSTSKLTLGYFYFFLVDDIMRMEEGETQMPEKFKSPTHITKEWIPFCEEELKPREGLEFANLD